MNLSQLTAEPPPRILTYRNRPRKRAEDRDAQIMALLAKPKMLREITARTGLARSYVQERLRALVKAGKITRTLVNGKDYIYRLAP